MGVEEDFIVPCVGGGAVVVDAAAEEAAEEVEVEVVGLVAAFDEAAFGSFDCIDFQT